MKQAKITIEFVQAFVTLAEDARIERILKVIDRIHARGREAVQSGDYQLAERCVVLAKEHSRRLAELRTRRLL